MIEDISGEDWVCYIRPTEADSQQVISWAPASWITWVDKLATPYQSYAVAVSGKGVLIGEIYLHEVPDKIMETANATWGLLKEGRYQEAMAIATHRRVKHGSKWKMVPV